MVKGQPNPLTFHNGVHQGLHVNLDVHNSKVVILPSKEGSPGEEKHFEGDVMVVFSLPEPTRNHRVALVSRAPEVRRSV